MTTALMTQLGYVVAAGLFIFGLKMLGSPATARRGNMVSAIGMLVAIVAALLDQGIVDFTWIAAGMLVGGAIGAIAARAVAMTAMPEMVALFNGSGGAASLLSQYFASKLEDFAVLRAALAGCTALLRATATIDGAPAPIKGCAAHTDEASCALPCRWCQSAAVPSACFSAKAAASLPAGVFECTSHPRGASDVAAAR